MLVFCAPVRERADGGLAPAPAFFWGADWIRMRASGGGFRGAFYFFGEDDGFGDLLHGFAGLAALLLESQVGLLFGDVQVALQDAFGAFQELASFQALGELGV